MSLELAAGSTVEGTARVVRVEGQSAWLEPEQTTSCGGCSAASTCGAKGIGTVASRLEARQFKLEGVARLRVGDRIVVGIAERTLLQGALAAYGLPLASAFSMGIAAQWIAESDAVTMGAMLAGLAAGILAARVAARRLGAHGGFTPQFIRHVTASDVCHPEGA